MTAAERFKARFADAMERVCVLEEQLEAALARVAELEPQEDEPAARPPRDGP